MDLKKTNAPVNTITYNKTVIEEPTGNVYEAITIMAKRANQINSEIKKELKRILFEENEEYYVYNDFFKNKSNYDNFLEMFSRYFEGKEYNKEIIISLKNGAKTKFNKKLYTIQKNLSEENKLVRDKKYLTK